MGRGESDFGLYPVDPTNVQAVVVLDWFHPRSFSVPEKETNQSLASAKDFGAAVRRERLLPGPEPT